VRPTDIAELPIRIQMSRRKGWRKPPNTVYVGRPGRFGNPFSVEEHGRAAAIALYEAWILEPAQAPLLAEARATLRGRNLGCWCRPGLPCHADVLLRLVNDT
jgi:hypothetical protein